MLDSEHGDPALVIAGHKFACECTGCLRKRGVYKTPRQQMGGENFTARQPLRLTPAQKAWVEEKGGNEYLRELVDQDRFSELPQI